MNHPYRRLSAPAASSARATFTRSRIAGSLLAAGLLLAQPIEAATVSLTATNGAGTSSFNSTLSWSDSQVPSAANDYVVAGGFSLRTLFDTGSATFAGNSLTLGDGTAAGLLVFKNQSLGSVITVNNLTLNNGEVQAGGTSTGAGHAVTLTGSGITLAPSATANRFNSGALDRSVYVTAPISGSGVLSKTSAGYVELSGNNTYTGGTTVNAGTLRFTGASSLPTTGAITVAANSTLAVPVNTAASGAGSLAGLLGGATSAGTAVTFATNSGVGVDLSGNLTYSSPINLGLLKLGTGTLELTGGGAYINGGAGFPLVVRQGTLLFNGGTHAATGEIVIGGTLGTAPGAAGYDAKLQVDSGTFTVSSWFSVGRGNGIGGVSSDLVVNNGATVTTNDFSAGFNGGNAANLPKGSITLNGSSILSINNTVNFAESPGANFTLNINDTSTFRQTANAAQTRVGGGNGAVGVINVNGGTASFERDLVLGYSGTGIGRLVLNSGTVNMANATERWLIINQNNTSQGELTVNGGTLNLNANTDIRFSIAASSTGTSFVTLNGGSIIGGTTSVVDLKQNSGVSSNNTLNLNGGVLAISQIITSNNVGNTTVNLNGGTLRAVVDSTNFLDLGGTGQRALVKAGGAIIDTNGFNVTSVQALEADATSTGGGLSKLGGGTLTLSGINTYTGNTTVNAGTLALSDNASLKFVIGANGVSNKITGGGSLTVDGDFDFDLTAAGTTLGNSWQVVDVSTLTETFGATFTVTGFTASGAKWVKPANGAFYEFDSATGVLRVIADPGISYPDPTVTAGSYNTAYAIGSDIILKVTASGLGNLTYQWYLNGSPISGANSATLTIASATAATNAVYSVVVTDSAAAASGQTPKATTVTFNAISVVPGSQLAVAYYRFEEGTNGGTISSATDSVGTNHLGVLGATTYTSASVPYTNIPATGASNALGANFAATGNNGLIAPTSGTLADAAFSDFTVEAFVRFSSLSGWQTIVGRDDTGNPGTGAGGQALFYLSKAGAAVGTGSNNGFRIELITKDNSNLQVNSTFVPVIGTWYHVAAVGNSGSGTLKLYVNGVEVGSTPGFTGLMVPASGSDAPWTVGRGDFGAADVDFFRGDVDEVRFSRAALPASQFLNTANGLVVVNPSVSVAPAAQAIATGGSTTLTATGSSNMSGTVSYQWYKDGAPISGQTGSTLSVNASGSYSVVATDSNSTTAGFPITATASSSIRVLTLPAAGARTIGLNFVGAGSSTGWSSDIGTLDAATSAGFYSSANWNNSASVTNVATQATPLALKESNGSTALGVSATWSSANTWASRSETGVPTAKTADARLLHGYIESRAATGASVTLSNIPYGSYDVYVYVTGGTAAANVGSVTLDRAGAQTYYFRLLQNDTTRPTATFTEASPYSIAAMIGEAVDAASAATAAPATFVRFTGVTGSDLTITAKDAVLNANAGGIAAVQIVDTTAAGTAYPPVVTTAPVSKFVKGGANVSFTVGATSQNSGGVISYEWQKDGSPISGQTSATLSLAGVTGSSSGNYSVIVTDNSSLGASTTTRTASLVVVDATRSLLINGDLNTAASATYAGEGILRADGTQTATGLGTGAGTWNGLLGGSGSATQALGKDSAGLTLPGLSFTYAGAQGAEDNTTVGNIADSAAVALSRDYLYTDDQATPLSGTIGGLSAFAGHRFTLLVYAYGKQTQAGLEATTSDTATVNLAAANNDLSQGSKATTTIASGFFDDAGRRLEFNNLEYTNGASAAYVSFQGVVAADGTISWTLSPDADAGRIPLVGFQLLLTAQNLAPAAPTGLAAVAGDGQVGLSWNASSGAGSYTIRRGTATGVYTTISAGTVTGTSYTDTTVTNGTTYYYVVAAANGIVTSAGSNEVTATPTLSLSAIQGWRQGYFGTSANTGNAANTADPDGDGQSNLLEYALGTNPTVAGVLPVTVARSGEFLTLGFSHINDATLVYKVEASNDLASWTTVQTYPAFTSAGSTTYTDNVALSGQPRRFLRLVVTAP